MYVYLVPKLAQEVLPIKVAERLDVKLLPEQLRDIGLKNVNNVNTTCFAALKMLAKYTYVQELRSKYTLHD